MRKQEQVKICYVVSTLRECGPTNQLLNILKYLDEDSYAPSIITLSPEPSNTMIQEFQKIGCPVKSLNLSRIKGFLFGKKKLRTLFQTIKPQLIHTQGVRADRIAQKANLTLPHVMTIRNFPKEDMPSKFGLIKGTTLSYLHLLAIKRGRNVVTCSQKLCEKFYKIGYSHLTFVQNGVDVNKFTPQNATEKEGLREKLGIEETARVFIAIGSLIPRKNMETIIEAFKRFGKIGVKLFILGDGFLKERLLSNAENNRNVIFVGHTNNVLEYLKIGDFYISAALSEGLPNTVLEAMACKIPPILSNIPSHHEIFENEKWDYFFNSYDVESLYTLMCQILKQSREELAQKVHSIVEQKFTAQKMSLAYQERYRALSIPATIELKTK